MQPDYQQRLTRFVERLKRSGQEAAIIIGVENIRYLSGLQNTHAHVAYLVIAEHQKFLVTDYRYAEQATSQCPGFEVIERDRQKVSLGEELLRQIKTIGATQIAFEQDHLSLGQFEALSNDMPGLQLTGISGWVESLRMQKDASEQDNIRQAAAIADRALAELVSRLKPGVSERDAALELEFMMQKGGSEGMAFDTIFLSGERSSLPHGIPSERPLTPGDLVTIDFGAVVNGYRSDMTRALVIGQPDKRQQAVFDTVFNAHQAAIAEVKAGVSAKVPYFASKAVLDASEFGQYQGEGIGHGLGLYVHEQPFLQSNCDIELQEDMVITIEPGIYIPGWGGVRLEDDICVSADASRYLTHSPRELLVID